MRRETICAIGRGSTAPSRPRQGQRPRPALHAQELEQVEERRRREVAGNRDAGRGVLGGRLRPRVALAGAGPEQALERALDVGVVWSQGRRAQQRATRAGQILKCLERQPEIERAVDHVGRELLAGREGVRRLAQPPQLLLAQAERAVGLRRPRVQAQRFLDRRERVLGASGGHLRQAQIGVSRFDVASARGHVLEHLDRLLVPPQPRERDAEGGEDTKILSSRQIGGSLKAAHEAPVIAEALEDTAEPLGGVEIVRLDREHQREVIGGVDQHPHLVVRRRRERVRLDGARIGSQHAAEDSDRLARATGFEQDARENQLRVEPLGRACASPAHRLLRLDDLSRDEQRDAGAEHAIDLLRRQLHGPQHRLRPLGDLAQLQRLDAERVPPLRVRRRAIDHLQELAERSVHNWPC